MALLQGTLNRFKIIEIQIKEKSPPFATFFSAFLDFKKKINLDRIPQALFALFWLFSYTFSLDEKVLKNYCLAEGITPKSKEKGETICFLLVFQSYK